MVDKFNLKKLGSYLKGNKEKLFWYWFCYQCIKGTLTLSIIWLPLFFLWPES
jgi:hypothetical protein